MTLTDLTCVTIFRPKDVLVAGVWVGGGGDPDYAGCHWGNTCQFRPWLISRWLSTLTKLSARSVVFDTQALPRTACYRRWLSPAWEPVAPVTESQHADLVWTHVVCVLYAIFLSRHSVEQSLVIEETDALCYTCDGIMGLLDTMCATGRLRAGYSEPHLYWIKKKNTFFF
jgi:hypothetical protein